MKPFISAAGNYFCTLHQKQRTPFRWEKSKILWRSTAPKCHIFVLLATLQRYADVKPEHTSLIKSTTIYVYYQRSTPGDRRGFSSPVLCFCTKCYTDLILAYSDNHTAPEACEREILVICHPRWGVQSWDTSSCSLRWCAQSRGEMRSQWNMLTCHEADSRAATPSVFTQQTPTSMYSSHCLSFK